MLKESIKSIPVVSIAQTYVEFICYSVQKDLAFTRIILPNSFGEICDE